MTKCSKVYLFVTIIFYLVISYFILLPFGDYLDNFLSKNGVEINSYHNDGILIFEIIIVSAIIAIGNIILSVWQRKKR